MIIMYKLQLTFVALMLSAGAAVAEKRLSVAPTSTLPAIDGKLSDQCWRDAQPLSGFVRVNGKSPTEQTTARITYDAANLYVAFTCHASAPDRIRANTEQNDSNDIFGDDNVELFLDTNCDRTTYYHFVINPAGMHYEAVCDLSEWSRKEDWNPNWERKTTINERSWEAEIKIPFDSLDGAAPANAAVWGVNFCRSWRLKEVGEFSSWTGAEGFNRPEQFALAVFGVAADSGAFAQAVKKAILAPDVDPKVDLHMDRFYYPPDFGWMQIELTAETDTGYDLKLEIRDARAELVAAREFPLFNGRKKYEISLEIADWPLGRYVVSVALRDEQEKTIHAAHRIFIKRQLEPAPAAPSALKATIRSDGIILLDGKPFCPFVAEGWSPASPFARDSFNIATYGDLGSLSIAKPLGWPRLNLPWVTRTETETFILMPEEEKMYADIRKEVLERRSDPTLLCRLLKYEAHLPMYRGTVEHRTALDNVAECRRINEFVKRIDPHHLSSIHVDRPKYLPDYKDVADIVEIAYWSSSYAPSLITNLTRDLEKVRSIIGPGRAFKFWIGNSVPSPDSRTAEEIRCACYLTLMRGAAGIGFNTGHGGLAPSYTRHWSVYPGLYRELMELFSILTTLQQEPLPEIIVEPEEIDYSLRRRDGKLYLIAVNTSKHLIDAKVSVADRSLMTKDIKVLFEERTIKPREAGFTDMFTAYEPHVYEFLSP